MVKAAKVSLQKLPLKIDLIACFDELDWMILVEEPPGNPVTILET